MHHQKSKSKPKSQHNVMNVSTESATETKKRSIVARDVGASGNLDSSSKPEQNLEHSNSATQLLRNKKDWSLIAGFVSGGVTNALLHPIDSVKTRMQASGRGQACGATSKTTFVDTVRFTRDMIRTEGWTSLYQGMVSSVIGASFSWGIYFYVYKMSKLYGKTWSEKLSTESESEGENIGKSDSEKTMAAGASIPTSVLLLSSLNAGFATCMLTHPIWLVKTRLQLQHNVGQQANGASPVSYRGTVDAFLKIARNEGVFRGLYAGLTPSLVLISHGVIHFVLYDVLKDMRLRHIDDSKETKVTEQRKEQLNSRDSLIIAAFAKSVAATVTYPFQVVKTRLQDVQNSVAYRSIAHPSMTTTNHQNQVYYAGMVDAMRKLYRMEGVGSFFRGIVPNVIRVTPAGALTLAIYEYFLHFSMTANTSRAT